MDKLSAEQRHKNMAAIHSKDTKPEMIVRRGLWSRGFRYRLNFVNGCFWHGHGVDLKIDNSCVSLVASGKAERKIENSECCKIPNTNREFWVAKIRRNQERDIEEQKRLAEMGWHCITIWECELNPKRREETLRSLVYTLNKIWLDDHQAVVTSYPKLEEEGEGYLKAAEERE